MVKIKQNNYFTDFIENFAASQGNSEKNTMPVKKTRKRSKLVRDGCSHFFFVNTYKYRIKKISLPHKMFFSGLLNFLNGELVNSQKLRSNKGYIMALNAIGRKMRIL